MGHRYYDPRTGRFLSQDPAGDGNNWYAYAGNNPVNAVDPSGLTPLMSFPEGSSPQGTDMPVWAAAASGAFRNYGHWNAYNAGQYDTPGTTHVSVGYYWTPTLLDGVGGAFGVGFSAVGSTATFHLWDGGAARNDPSFGVSRGLADVGVMAGTAAFGGGLGSAGKGVEEVGTLYRFGRNAETLDKLAGDAAAAERQIGHYGVSTTSKINPAKGYVPKASLSEIQKYFEVVKTGAPNHYTVKLPNPLTQENVDIFNGLFGR